MTKKKRKPNRQVLAPPRNVVGYLDEAEALLARGEREDAKAVLEHLARRYPRQADVLGTLANVYYELQDVHGYLRTCRRLLEITPDDPDLMAGLAGAYLLTARPVQGVRTFRRFLQRWPEHPRADEVRAQLKTLEPLVEQLVADTGLTGDDAEDLQALHEDAQVLVEQGEALKAEKAISQLLRRVPNFVPGLNNLSQILAVQGQFDRAIETARRVLSLDPGNPHALSNLTRYFVLSGRSDQARESADQLQRLEWERPDLWVKRAEALSYLGDDRGVLGVFEAAQGLAQEDPVDMPLLYHLAAAAALRLGEIATARRYWKEALRLQPGMELARENLGDLDRPVGERHAPWAFSFRNWLPLKAVEDLSAQLSTVSGRTSERTMAQGMQRFLRRYPQLNTLVPTFLDRGDPQTREFALALAGTVRSPEMLAALRDFALSDRGPDALRHQAAQVVSEAGLLPSGPVRMWQNGEWREIVLMGFEIHSELLEQRPPALRQIHAEAGQALRARDGGRAEHVLLRGLEMAPDDTALLYNLAVAYQLQGRENEAEALLRELHEKYPDYLFARVSLARKHLEQKEIEAARALIDSLMSRKRLHISEFTALCSVQIELALAQGRRNVAESWLNMLAEVEPDHPSVAILEERLHPTGWKQVFHRHS